MSHLSDLVTDVVPSILEPLDTLSRLKLFTAALRSKKTSNIRNTIKSSFSEKINDSTESKINFLINELRTHQKIKEDKVALHTHIVLQHKTEHNNFLVIQVKENYLYFFLNTKDNLILNLNYDCEINLNSHLKILRMPLLYPSNIRSFLLLKINNFHVDIEDYSIIQNDIDYNPEFVYDKNNSRKTAIVYEGIKGISNDKAIQRIIKLKKMIETQNELNLLIKFINQYSRKSNQSGGLPIYKRTLKSILYKNNKYRIYTNKRGTKFIKYNKSLVPISRLR